jgi:uncharacterized protein YkwD
MPTGKSQLPAAESYPFTFWYNCCITLCAIKTTQYNKMKNLKIISSLLFMFIGLTSFVIPFNLNVSPKEDDYTGYLSDLERGVVEELNLARMQPETYANFLTEYSKLYVGRELREQGETTILTNEGKSAVNEAIRFLRNQRSMSFLRASKGMSRAAEDMVRMQGKTSRIGHIGTDGSSFSDRISRYGTWSGSCSENIDYGFNAPRRIVMALIIDDGVRSRGHRTSIFNPGFKRVGVACGYHKIYQYMCVIELAQSYDER